MFLEQIVRNQDNLIALRKKVATLPKRVPVVAVDEGRNIGIRIAESDRLRIVAAQKRHGIRTYAETVRALLTLGIEANELVGK